MITDAVRVVGIFWVLICICFHLFIVADASCPVQMMQVLILHGVGDRLVPVSNSRRLAGIIPHAELIEYRDCGHVPQEELPKQFIKSVKAFVEQC